MLWSISALMFSTNYWFRTGFVVVWYTLIKINCVKRCFHFPDLKFVDKCSHKIEKNLAWPRLFTSFGVEGKARLHDKLNFSMKWWDKLKSESVQTILSSPILAESQSNLKSETCRGMVEKFSFDSMKKSKEFDQILESIYSIFKLSWHRK